MPGKHKLSFEIILEAAYMTYLPLKPSELNDSDMKIPACDFLKYQQNH